MTLTLFRAGSLTPLSDVPPRNQWFEELSGSYRKSGQVSRNESVFASLSLEEARAWTNWRFDMELDANIWSITITDLSTPIFAYLVNLYENAGFERTMKQYANYGAEFFVEKYWETGVDIRQGLGSLKDGKTREVLIPYQVAAVAKWVMVEETVPPVFEDEETYFDMFPQ